MNYPKMLLMPLGTGSEAEERLNGSLIVAKTLEAHLQVLHTNLSANTIVPQEVFVMSSSAKASLKKIFEQHTESETERLKDVFSRLCETHGVASTAPSVDSAVSASWLETQGLRSALVAQYGKSTDLIVLARPLEGKPTASFEAAILETGKPVLLIPRRLQQFSLDTVVIGWNGSPAVNRSLSLALPILQRAKQVIFLSTERYTQQEPSPARMCNYLQVHGINASHQTFKRKQSSKGAGLLEKAEALNSQLLVLGAYGKSRFHESVFGGVTHFMLENSKIPMFYSH